MAYPPRAFCSERYIEINGKKEPVIAFGDFDGVLPVFREGHTEDYLHTHSLLNELGYRTEDFDKDVAKIYKEGVKDPTLCDTTILVGLAKSTVSSEAQPDFKWSIEHAFEVSDYTRAARNVAVEAKRMRENQQ